MGSGAKGRQSKALPPRVPSDKPPFGVKEIKDAIPAHCFERSAWKSSVYMIRDMFYCAVIYYLATFIDHPMVPGWLAFVLWSFYTVIQGTVATGLWVVGHECGHHSFAESDTVSDMFGIVIHTMLLVPYHSWRISHGKHHRSTGDLERDEVHIPPTKNEVPESDRKGQLAGWLQIMVESVGMLTFGWPLYLFGHVTGRKYGKQTNHFNPNSPLFSENEKHLVIMSDIALVLWLGVLGYWAFAIATPMWVVKAYFLPYLIVNFWLVLITKLQHSDISLPHYQNKQWTWVRGALATVDRDYGICNYLHHNIGDTHVLHHLFSKIPHYHAQEATEAIKPVLGKYYRMDRTPIAVALWNTMRYCRWVEEEQEEGVMWYRPGMPTKTN